MRLRPLLLQSILLALSFSHQAFALDILPYDTIVLETGNHPVSVRAGGLSYSASIEPGCDSSIESNFSGTAILISVLGPEQRCKVYLNTPANLKLHVSSSNGDIDFIGQANLVNLETANGAIYVASSVATEFLLSTSNGDLVLNQLNGPVSVSTTNGDITYDAGIGLFSVKATNSVIQLNNISLPAKSKNLITNVNGQVLATNLTTQLSFNKKKTGLVLRMSTINGDRRVDYGRVRLKRNRGGYILQDGKDPASISIKTVNADITVRK